MRTSTIALALMACFAAGCETMPTLASGSALPDCFERNYDSARRLFTLRDAAPSTPNQQCLLTVEPAGATGSATRLTAGRYAAKLANGGGGGAGGTVQRGDTGEIGGGGGGGGAGAREVVATLDLAPGTYKLTIGAGGPGGSACMPKPFAFGGGPGWLGSPSNIVRVPGGELVMGVPGADTYVRPSRAQNDRSGGTRDGHGGSGAGQTSGGDGGHTKLEGRPKVLAEAGDAKPGSAHTGGAPGFAPSDVKHTGGGGGGGATNAADGGGGGGETRTADLPPARGSLGSGGGGGEGNSSGCDAGAQGGHGYISLSRI